MGDPDGPAHQPENDAVNLAGYIRDARSADDPCEHWVGQPLAVCSPCLRDRLLPHFAAYFGVVIVPPAQPFPKDAHTALRPGQGRT